MNIEEPQRREPQGYGVRTVLQLGEEHRLILANLLWAKLIGRTTEVPAEMRNTVKVSADAVSYTHLDVYKRQGSARGQMGPDARPHCL